MYAVAAILLVGSVGPLQALLAIITGQAMLASLKIPVSRVLPECLLCTR